MAKVKGGFGKVDNRIIRDSTLTPEARLIYTLLAGYANTDRQCYPSVKHLIQESGMSSATVVDNERERQRFVCRFGYLERFGELLHELSVSLCRK